MGGAFWFCWPCWSAATGHLPESNLSNWLCKVENTGGGTLIEFGRFENGLYYGLNEETLVIYNDDYHQAYLNQDEEDFYQWQEDHIINAFDPDDMEYSIVAGQSKQFKPEIKVYECMDCGKEFENPREGACPYCGSGDIAE